MPCFSTSEMKSAGVYRARADLQKCGFAENEIFSGRIQVGEVASPAPGDRDLFADTLSVLQHNHLAAAFACFNRAQETCRPASDNHRIFFMDLQDLSPML